jgi:hypothetical protein
MSSLVARGIIAVLLAALGTAAVSWGNVERELAQAEESIAALDYTGVHDTLARAERFFERVSWVPFAGSAALNEVRARRAAVHYWQRNFAAIVPAQADPIGAVPAENVELQLIVANAVLRQAHSAATTPAEVLRALDAGIATQLAVLKNSARNEDAAFNYEYLLRLRAAVAVKPDAGLGSDDAGTEKTTHGQPGGAPKQSDPSDFKIHIPLEAKEFENEAEGQQAGKAAERERRG